MRIILASASPRRRELLRNMGLRFETAVSNAPEQLIDGESPQDTVMRLAAEKAAVAAGHTDAGEKCIVIGADTVVVIDGEILGKPSGKEQAAEMLARLSGRTHTVYTGICVLESCTNKRVCDCVATQVTFRELTDDQISRYIKTGEPMDKAGAYGIQQLGSMLVERINGDYFSVVGLPVCRLSEILAGDFGIDLAV